MDNLVNANIVFASLFAVACSSQVSTTSIGDSPVHEIKCPSFSAWEICVARGTKKFCNGAESRLLSPTSEELDRLHGDGRIVSTDFGDGLPAAARITYRKITIMCEE